MTAAVTQCSAFTVYIDNFVLQAKNTAEVKTSCNPPGERNSQCMHMSLFPVVIFVTKKVTCCHEYT